MSFKYIYILVLAFCSLINNGFAQLNINGKVISELDSMPVVQAVIVAMGKSVGTLSAYNGTFSIRTDSTIQKIVIKKAGYKSDTLYIKKLNGQPVIVLLSPLAREMKEFVVKSIRPQKLDAIERRKEWSYILDRPQPTLQSPISWFYNQYSKRGKELRKIDELFAEDEKKRVVNEKFPRSVAHEISGLYGRALDSFMRHCRPSYEVVTSKSDYEIIEIISNCYKQFLRKQD